MRSSADGERAVVEAQWIKASPGWVKEALDRKACLEMFMEKFGVDAPLLSVPMVARMLGMSRQWIYGQIKSGEFFLPVRMAGQSPLVPVDAFIDWYLGGEAMVAKPAKAPQGLGVEPAKEQVAARPIDTCGAFDVDRMVAEALGEIGAAKGKRPGSRAASAMPLGRQGP